MQITLPFPPSVNGLYSTDFRTKRRFKSKRYNDWCGQAETALFYNKDRSSFSEPIKITYIYGRPDKRKRDLANLLKAVDDLLVTYGVIADDSLIHEIHASWGDVIGVQLTIEAMAK